MDSPGQLGISIFWVRADETTAPRTFGALKRFGAPVHDLTTDDLATPGYVFQIGVAPIRTDILTMVSGLNFDDAWRGRLVVQWDGLNVPILSLDDLVKNKRSTGRTKDLADVEIIEQPRSKGSDA